MSTQLKPASCRWCNGADSELRRRVLSNNSVQLVYQCLTCGRSASNAIKKDFVWDPDGLPAFDEGLNARYNERDDCKRAQKRAAWFAEHDAYLQTTAWHIRRTKVLKRAKYLCEGCGQRTATQVHHLTYEHWQNELLWELVAICDECHAIVHSRSGALVVKGELL